MKPLSLSRVAFVSAAVWIAAGAILSSFTPVDRWRLAPGLAMSAVVVGMVAAVLSAAIRAMTATATRWRAHAIALGVAAVIAVLVGGVRIALESYLAASTPWHVVARQMLAPSLLVIAGLQIAALGRRRSLSEAGSPRA